MRSRANLFELHVLAAAYGQRPSDIVGIHDRWLAYQFDLACVVVGRDTERKLADGASPDVLFADGAGQHVGRFRSAAPFVRKTMKVPDSGIW